MHRERAQHFFDMKINKLRNKHKLIATSLLAVLFAGFSFIGPHWWSRVSSANVIYNGKTSPASRLYRAQNGEFVSKLEEPNESGYWIMPKNKLVCTASPSNFSYYSLAAFVVHNDQYGVDLTYTAKTGINPNIVFRRNSVAFTGLRKQRIQVTW